MTLGRTRRRTRSLAFVVALSSWLVLAAGASRATAEEVPRSFARFEETPLAGSLETADVAFVQSETGSTLLLVSAIHLGERRYYEEIQRDLEGQDAVFYEGVEGESPETEAIFALYARLATRFDLALQSKSMHKGPNFVHADVTVGELEKALGGGEISRELDAGQLRRVVEEIEGLPRVEAAKWAVGQHLGRLKAHVERHVVVRNDRCFEVARRQIAGRPGGRFAVLYGAAHMIDLAPRFQAQGFVPTSVRWRQVFAVTRADEVKAEAAVRAAVEQRRQTFALGVLLGLLGLFLGAVVLHGLRTAGAKKTKRA